MSIGLRCEFGEDNDKLWFVFSFLINILDRSLMHAIQGLAMSKVMVAPLLSFTVDHACFVNRSTSWPWSYSRFLFHLSTYYLSLLLLRPCMLYTFMLSMSSRRHVTYRVPVASLLRCMATQCCRIVKRWRWSSPRHSRLVRLVPIKSPCATLWWIKILACTVSKLLRSIGQIFLVE